MPSSQLPSNPDVFALITALIVSVVSGTISVTRKIVNGTPVSIWWLISEYLAAILCGWIAYDAYDSISRFLPEWVTMFMLVAVAAHTGGKLLQMAETVLTAKLPKALRDQSNKK